MRQLLIIFVGLAVLYSCKKENTKRVSGGVTTGFLRFSDPAYDGVGLYYETDSAETIIIKDDTVNLTSRDPKYSDFVNIHSRLTYTDSSERGCLSGMAPGPCAHPLRMVRVNKLEKLQ
jgi:hypothetical protein